MPDCKKMEALDITLSTEQIINQNNIAWHLPYGRQYLFNVGLPRLVNKLISKCLDQNRCAPYTNWEIARVIDHPQKPKGLVLEWRRSITMAVIKQSDDKAACEKA